MSTKRVPDLLIEQYALGELPPATARRVERSEGFEQRVAKIRRDNEATLARYPAGVYAARIRNQYEAEYRDRSRDRTPARTVGTLAMVLPAAAALLVVGFLLFGGLDVGFAPQADPQAEITRLKGVEPAIAVYRADPRGVGGVQRLSDGDNARAGDVVQLSYQAADARYGVIVSMDGRGAVTLHYPPDPGSVPQLIPGGEQTLPYAYRLDDAPRFEMFLFITSRTGFDVAAVVSELERQASRISDDPEQTPDLPQQFEIRSLTIRKEE